MQPAATRLALGAALSALGSVVFAEGEGPAPVRASESCAVAPPGDLRIQQQAGAERPGGGSQQSGPDGRGAPSPAGTLPPPAQAGSTPAASLTVSGSELSLAFPTPCATPSPAAAATKAHKTRSNIQNN